VSILDEILERKRQEVEAARAALPAEVLAGRAREHAEAPRGFRAALLGGPAPSVIAEIKSRSPSKGVIRADFEPVECARAYQQGGAAALSVLTDAHFFGGKLEYLSAIRASVDLPLLRKDFVVDDYQIDEARVAGADAVLLIVAALEAELLTGLHKRAESLGLDVLVEVHNEAELDLALAVGAGLIGVNNRDLRSFEVDLGATVRLADRLGDLLQASGNTPARVTLVAESGIATAADIERLQAVGASAFLVGESLMKQADLSAALRQLRGSP